MEIRSSAKTPDALRQSLIAEVQRRIDIITIKPKSATKRGEAYISGELSGLRGVLSLLENLIIEP